LLPLFPLDFMYFLIASMALSLYMAFGRLSISSYLGFALEAKLCQLQA